MTIANPIKRRLTSDEYYRMADIGLFQDQRAELIDGEVVTKAPQRDIHSATVSLAFRAILKLVGERAWVRCQLPMSIGDASEPEPDISVVPGSEHDYIGTGHPTKAILIVEVSETTLLFDRKIKASLYANAGFADYWIIDLNQRRVEVRRNPAPDASAHFGFSYSDVRNLSSGDRIQLPGGFGDISVSELLP